MKIADKIKESNDEIMKDPENPVVEIANRLGELAADAICGGINSRKWEEYMKIYACNTKQLERLCGEDTTFIADKSNKRALAYIVGNSVCTIETRKGDEKLGTLNYLTPEMIAALDAGIDDQPDSE